MIFRERPTPLCAQRREGLSWGEGTAVWEHAMFVRRGEGHPTRISTSASVSLALLSMWAWTSCAEGGGFIDAGGGFVDAGRGLGDEWLR